MKNFYLTIDLRSLGLFRLLLGTPLLYAWIDSWPYLATFYTSSGVMPIDAPLPHAGGRFHFSLLDGLTSLPAVQAFFLVGLVCYIAFLLGAFYYLDNFLGIPLKVPDKGIHLGH